MIVTVTLNPSVDRVVELYELRLGDTNRVTDGVIDPGGKGVNVSRMIRELGGDSLATGFVAGSLGKFVEDSLNHAGIRDAFIHIPGQTRMNLAIVETRWHRHTMLNEAGPVTDPKYLQRLRRLLENRVGPRNWVVLAGSVPPHLPLSVYADLTELLHAKGALVCLDADGEALALGVQAMPDLIKPNREELERLVHRQLPTLAEVVQAAWEVQNGGVPMVVVSLGRQGAIAVSSQGAWRVLPPPVVTVSAIGSGDSLVAGLVLALSRGQALPEGLRLGTAAGAATAMQPGTRLGCAADIERLLPEIVVESLAVAQAA
jgi:1-phosphofructokinase